MCGLAMINERRAFNLLSLVVSALLVSSCALDDLRDDSRKFNQNYGAFKGQVSGSDDGSNIVVGLFKHDGEQLILANARTVSEGETFYLLVQEADYVLKAFRDLNGDFIYQPGEPAAHINDPHIKWLRDQKIQGRLDWSTLQVQPIELTSNTRLESELDFSLVTLRRDTDVAQNFLTTVSWDDERFSDENVKLGEWQPSAFIEKIDYGLYALNDFDPTQKTIVLVHGISDSPRVFETLANEIPNDYQVLMFHYPSAVSLEYTAYLLSVALNELTRRFQIPQLDIVAHSTGGLVSKGAISLSNASARERMRLFVSIASPYGGHAGAAAGIKWSPVKSPAWFAMAPGSNYLQEISTLDLSNGPTHHLIYSYSHERDGKREDNDGVVTVESQLVESAQHNATAMYGIADNHVGAVSNPCTLKLLTAILQDGNAGASVPGCGADDTSPASLDTAPVD